MMGGIGRSRVCGRGEVNCEICGISLGDATASIHSDAGVIYEHLCLPCQTATLRTIAAMMNDPEKAREFIRMVRSHPDMARRILAMNGVYGMVCPYCGGAIGSFGPHICSTPPAPPVFMSDTDIEDQVRERIDTWSLEQQMIAYKYLHAQGLRVGSGLDHNLSEERRKRHLAEKQA